MHLPSPQQELLITEKVTQEMRGEDGCVGLFHPSLWRRNLNDSNPYRSGPLSMLKSYSESEGQEELSSQSDIDTQEPIIPDDNCDSSCSSYLVSLVVERTSVWKLTKTSPYEVLHFSKGGPHVIRPKWRHNLESWPHILLAAIV